MHDAKRGRRVSVTMTLDVPPYTVDFTSVRKSVSRIRVVLASSACCGPLGFNNSSMDPILNWDLLHFS